jgi:hypothetical protein
MDELQAPFIITSQSDRLPVFRLQGDACPPSHLGRFAPTRWVHSALAQQAYNTHPSHCQLYRCKPFAHEHAAPLVHHGGSGQAPLRTCTFQHLVRHGKDSHVLELSSQRTGNAG